MRHDVRRVVFTAEEGGADAGLRTDELRCW